jgi:Integrase core domain
VTWVPGWTRCASCAATEIPSSSSASTRCSTPAASRSSIFHRGAPRAVAICERLVGTLRRELLDQILTVNQQHLRRILDEYTKHYNDHRPHWTLGQHPRAVDQILPRSVIDVTAHHIRRSPILSGLINEYDAA